MFDKVPADMAEALSQWWLDTNWSLVNPQKKLATLAHFGVGADSASTMQHALDHLTEEVGAKEVMSAFIDEVK